MIKTEKKTKNKTWCTLSLHDTYQHTFYDIPEGTPGTVKQFSSRSVKQSTKNNEYASEKFYIVDNILACKIKCAQLFFLNKNENKQYSQLITNIFSKLKNNIKIIIYNNNFY